MQSTLTMLENELTEKGCFNTEMHPAFELGVQCISPIASYKMKLMMAVTELAVFTSQLRKPIQMMDGTLVPINIMSFVLAGSGNSKDSSIAYMRKALSEGYSLINDYRKSHAKYLAEQRARFNGEDAANYKKYYIKPRELLAGTGTVEGQMSHWNQLEKGELGSAYIIVSELGSELQNSKDIRGNIEALAKGYDLGRIPAKIVKANESQIDSIQALPISSLMFGAEESILYNEQIKKVFIEEFMSKLSRRSYLCFDTAELPEPKYSSTKEIFEAKRKISQNSLEAQQKLSKVVSQMVSITTREPLTLTEEASYLYEIYLEYNSLKSRTMSKLHPLCALARKHMHWKAQKVAGAIAMMEYSEEITENHMLYAIRFTELFKDDIALFETELAKEPYELFSEYIRTIAEDNKAHITTHNLRKLGYISGSASTAKVAELVKLVTSYDTEGIYTITDTGVAFEAIVKTPTAGISYLPVKGSKEQRAKQCASGYQYAEIEFKQLATMLKKDYAYTPFKFKDGIRSNENIEGGVKWVVLDIDTSTITASEAHEILADINHHISLTSNPDNDFKFRVLVELDSYVELKSQAWKHFTKSIADYLALTADILPQSQIYFSYADRPIYSVLDKSTIEVRDHILFANAQLASKPSTPKPVTKAEAQTLLNDKMGTFHYAFECTENGSLALIKMAHHAHDLGMSNDEIESLVKEVNNYWDYPMDETRLENTLLKQVRRF